MTGKTKPKILIIAGPTATGKTRLAIDLSKKFNGEIVSADSRQVYRGMDIITGKDLPLSSKFKVQSEKLKFKVKSFRIGYYEVNDVPIWLYDVVEPDQKFSVADFYELAWKVIRDIWRRGKLPIVVGGTGFYIKALTEGLGTMGIGPDWKLRKKLSNLEIEKLREMLEELDPERSRRMNESDRKNPRRLIRAIEIARQFKNPHFAKATRGKQNFKLDKLTIGLNVPYEVLYQRIDQRVNERVKMGAEEEIKKLLKDGYDWDNSMLGTTIGYREWREYFEGKTAKDGVIQRWKFDEHSFARRQMTWFRKTRDIHWSDVAKDDWQEKVEKLVKAWYS